MQPQNYQRLDAEVVRRFIDVRAAAPPDAPRLQLSWSNWGFGPESLDISAARLEHAGIHFIELHGNRYGPDLGYRTAESLRILGDHGIKVAGICGMIMPDQEFASNRPQVRQRAIDYFRRQVDFCVEMGGSYVLFGLGAVGRPQKYDDNEFNRAAEAVRIVADHFAEHEIRATVEPIRPEEVSLGHTFADVARFIELVDHPAVQHINGDLYHMLAGETHIGATILEYGHMMNNLHMADTNRQALGRGLLDMDIVLMALYAVGHNAPDRFCTPEPLGPGGNPYTMMYEEPDAAVLDELVGLSARTFFEREEEILAADEHELLTAAHAV